MVATLDDYMNNRVKGSQKNSIPTLDDFMNSRASQSNVVTPRTTSLPKSTTTAQAPVNKNVTIGEGLGNLGNAIGEGVGNFVQTVADNPLGFAKDTVNSLVVQPTKEFVSNVAKPDVTQSPFLAIGGGVAKGAVELPQNLWNLGVDAVNAYNNTPEQNQYKAHYVEDIANALQGNKLYQEAYQKPKRANEAIAELGSFAAPMAAAGKVGNVAGAIKNANNIAKESTRIASKLTDAQKIKYANQIQKLAQNNVLNGTVRTSANDIAGNMATGFGLGALEGDTLQDRIANGTGMAALGLALTGGHAAAQKAWNSKRALELRKNTAETLNNLTNEYDGVSKTIAGIDNALNTNLSNNASDLTRLRKEYGELSSKDQNYKRNISDEEKALLDDASKLSDEQQTEIFERNKLGSRERALKISKEVKAELANQQPQKHSTTVKNRKEAEKWFDDIEKREQTKAREKEVIEPDYETPDEATEFWRKLAEEENNPSHAEGDLSHVKSETDVVNPKQEETRLKNDSGMSENIHERTVDKNGRVTVYNPDGTIKVRFKRNTIKEADTNKPREILDSERAEGSDSGNWYTQRTDAKPKRLGDENMYEMQEVEGTKPTTDEELMQEIEAAKRQKDVPVVRSKANVKSKTPAQRMAEKLHNERANRAWIKHLRDKKIKSLNDDTKTKSMLDIVFENKNNKKNTDFYNYSQNKSYRYITENKAIRKLFQGQPMESGKEITRTIGEIADVFPELKKHLEGYDGFEQMKVKLTNDGFGYDTHGLYHQDSRSITLNAKSEKNAETIQHEFQHGKDHFDVLNSPEGSRERALWQSSEKRNREYTEFRNEHENEVIDILQNKRSINDLTEEEKSLINEYIRLDNRYRNSYAERRARKAGEGVVNGRFGTIQKKSNGTGIKRVQRQSELHNSSRTREYDRGTSGEASHVRDSNATGNEINFYNKDDKLINRTLNWFDKTKNNHTKFYHQFLEATPEIKKFTDAFKTINDKREAFFREFGTYTDERMKARLFKQSKSGEGVYFQQGTKRNPKVEWGKESNDKVGFTGKKELEGISERGTTQEGLARGFSDIVRMEHTRDRINFLKENFSKPQEGFVPVNSKLLANAMYFGKSKAWYETIRKGQEAIEKTFDEKNAKEWNELYKTTEADKSDIYIPKDLLDMSITGEKELPLDYLATYGKMRGTKGQIKGMAKIAGALLDFYTDRFKRKVLTSASFFTNNRFGNQIMIAMTADKPQDYIKGIADAFKLKENEVPTEILESTLAEAIQQEANGKTLRKYFSEKNNVFDNLARVLDGDEIGTKSLSGFGKAAATASNWLISKPNDVFKRISHFTGNVNERWERFERKQAYSQALTKMQREKVLKTAKQFAGIHELAEVAKKDTLIREAVIDKVADVLGDYNNFSKFEKNVLKKLIPFYAWNRTITRHIISLAKDNPVKATLVAFETYRLLNQDDGLEDYQHGSIKTGWRNNRTDVNVVINKASMIPYNTLFDMVSGENIGSFSPLITKPLEAARGEKFFKPASEITSKNWKRTTQDKKSGYVNTKTGEFREGKAPASVRAGYLAKDAMETVYPMTGSPMTKGLPDAIKHYGKTGEFLFPDKQFDASLGGFYDGDKAGTYKRGRKTYQREFSAKNRLDLKYQLMNRTLGLGIQPEHKVSKEQKEKYARQRKRMQGK